MHTKQMNRGDKKVVPQMGRGTFRHEMGVGSEMRRHPPSRALSLDVDRAIVSFE
jgi:hypothetical protein